MAHGIGTIVLTGMMGSGKTTVGQLLAARLGYAFVDSDSEIERQAGMTVPELFAGKGEACFRALEQEVVLQQLRRQNLVLSLGGGAFMTGAIRAEVKARAFSVWLQAGVETLLQRLPANAGLGRPLLAGASMEEVLRGLLESRAPVYGEADLTVPTDGLSPETVADKIIERISSGSARVEGS